MAISTAVAMQFHPTKAHTARTITTTVDYRMAISTAGSTVVAFVAKNARTLERDSITCIIRVAWKIVRGACSYDGVRAALKEQQCFVQKADDDVQVPVSIPITTCCQYDCPQASGENKPNAECNCGAAKLSPCFMARPHFGACTDNHGLFLVIVW